MLAKWMMKLSGPFRRSIRNKLILTMIGLAVVPIVAITALAAENSRRSMEAEVISTNLSNMKWTGIYLGDQFAQLNNLIYTVLISPHLSDYLANAGEASLSSQFTAQRNITDTLTNLFYSAGNHVVGVELYLKEYNKLFTINASQSDIESPAVVPAPYKLLFDQNKDFMITTDSTDGAKFQLIRSINRFENQEKLGGISLQIRWGVLDQTLDLLGRGSEHTVLIAGADGKVLYQPWGSTPAGGILDRVAGTSETQGYFRSDHEYVFYNTIDPVGLKLVTVIPNSFINQSALATMNFGLIIGAVSVVVAILLAVILAWRLATPIVSLARSIQGFGMMKEREMRHSNRVDEIGLLETKLDQMSHRIREHIRTEYMISLEKKSAELKALQAQINPHFLQNTLQMIGSMLFKNSPAESYGVIRSLSDMFRYIIREPEDLAPLRAELNHLNNYMQIQQQRFAARLNYSLEVDEGTRGSFIPKLSLQPIVENAFFHGLEPQEGPWELEVTVARAGEDTVIIIRDNGVGIEPGKLAELQGRLTRRSGKLWTHGERIGLSNVASRIHLHFGNSYGIRVESTEGQGTTVTVTIPL
ncbi:sensor histidine kinase [Paenibacillus jilunlii]|uniref:histidine kinase n=1 Tax=Paenibacillus jilunlii TaxID=682956 RepID=A0A1G9UWY8_9BACL|nr:sensor histidine kinase [Paenibacillus jilunlii]KWX78201.1 histidine kinase [Paenibacillus jilunlii]SDM64359.1 two-component system, sensor histidine kinase YesM [Paenibacillus jilunlii]